jgi:lipoprotein-releasing system permease protein
VLGDKVTLVTPEAALTPLGVIPRFKRFTLVGIFNPGAGFGFDSSLALINLQDAQALYQFKNGVTGIRLKIKDLYAAPEFTQQLAKNLTSDYFISNWTQTYGPLFKALALEKNMMFLILLLIIAVAAFNLVSSLVMVVNDKRADIAILRTFGATPSTVMIIFIVQGFVVGFAGTLIGLIGGVVLAGHVTAVVNFIQNTFHLQLFTSNVYYLNYLPSKIQTKDVMQVCIAAFILSLLATLYPAWRASRTEPAEALRYE